MTGVAEFVSVLVPSIAVGVGFFLFFVVFRLRKPEIFQPRIAAPGRGEGDKLLRSYSSASAGPGPPPVGRKKDAGEAPEVDERLTQAFGSDEDEPLKKTSIDLNESRATHLQGDQPIDYSTLDGLPRPSPLSSRVFGWLPELLRISEEEVLHTAGLDVVVYLRTIKLLFQLCLISALYGIIVLIPVYATGEGPGDIMRDNEEGEEEMMMDRNLDQLDKISLSNIADGSPRLWATFFAVYITTIASCYLIYKNYSEIFQLAVKFHTREIVANYSIMVTDIPDGQQNPEALEEYFSHYPGNVDSVSISKDVEEIQEVFDKRQKFAKRLRDARKEIRKTGERPQYRGGKYCAKVDTIDFCTSNVKIFDKHLKELVKNPLEYGPVAFVTFTSLESATQAILDVPQYDQDWLKSESLTKAIRAPEPRDIRWGALGVLHDKRERHVILVNIFMTLLLLFWTIPVSFLSSIMNLDSLQSLLPFLKPILDASPAIKGIIQGLLPTLALKIFMAILPIIIYISHTKRYPKTLSHLDLLCTRRYYLCLVFMVFLVVTISGTLFGSIEGFVDGGTNIQDLINQIATILPKQATFFMGYIALGAFGLPIELSRIVDYVLGALLGISWDYDDLPFMEYRISLPNHLLMFTIAIAYTAVAPFMLIWIVIYFAIAFVVAKYQTLYVYFQRFETGGRYWPDIVNRIVTALVLFQVTSFGCVTLRLGAVQGPLILPSILIIFYIQYRSHKKFRSVFFTSAVRYSKTVDIKRGDVKFPPDSYEVTIIKRVRDLPDVSRGTVEIEEKNAV